MEDDMHNRYVYYRKLVAVLIFMLPALASAGLTIENHSGDILVECYVKVSDGSGHTSQILAKDIADGNSFMLDTAAIHSFRAIYLRCISGNGQAFSGAFSNAVEMLKYFKAEGDQSATIYPEGEHITRLGIYGRFGNSLKCQDKWVGLYHYFAHHEFMEQAEKIMEFSIAED